MYVSIKRHRCVCYICIYICIEKPILTVDIIPRYPTGVQFCPQAHLGTPPIPSHHREMRQHESCKVMEHRDAQTELQAFVSLIHGPGAAFHRERLKKVQQPLRVGISTGVMDSDHPSSKCFPRSGQCGFQQLPLCWHLCPWEQEVERKRRENMNIHLKISSGFKGEKAKKEDFLIPVLP